MLGSPFLGRFCLIPAGSFRFWQAWVYIGIQFVPAIFAFIYFSKHDPKLIERRSLLKEKVPEQKRIMGLLYVVWLVASLLPGFDHRYGWSRLPLWLTVLSQVLVVGELLMAYWVLTINPFAARAIQVESGQTVISGGPYRTIPFPMYAGMCVMWLSTPLALGSYFALPAFVLLIPLTVLRLLNEEQVLRRELAGYNEYCSRTHFRLVPLVWLSATVAEGGTT